MIQNLRLLYFVFINLYNLQFNERKNELIKIAGRLLQIATLSNYKTDLKPTDDDPYFKFSHHIVI